MVVWLGRTDGKMVGVVLSELGSKELNGWKTLMSRIRVFGGTFAQKATDICQSSFMSFGGYCIDCI